MPPMTPSRSRLRSLCRPWGIAALLILAYALNAGIAAWQGVSFTPYNGHFQNFWPLHRMDGGEIPFRDFPVYLGAAQLYLAWPLFKLLGSDFQASSTAHDLLGFGLLGLSVVAAARIPGIRWPTTAFMALAFVFSFEVLAPGNNSALSIRSFAPFIAAALAWMAMRDGASSAWKTMPGIGAGLLVVWSADYGIPSAAALFLAMVVARPSIRYALLLAGTALLTLVLAATIVSWGHPLDWLRTAILEPSAMQGWYFNPDPGKKAFSLLDLPWWDVPLVTALASAGVLAILLLRQNGTAPMPRRRMAALLTLLLASGGGFVLSCLAGTYDVRYALPMWRTVVPGVLVVMGFLGGAVWRRLRRTEVPRHFAGVCAAAFAVTMLFAMPPTLPRDPEVQGLHRDATASVIPEMGGKHWPEVARAADLGRRLGAEWDRQGRAPGERLRSLYGSVLALLSSSRQPGPDYVIHALSPEAQARFMAPVLDRSVAAVETLDHDRVSWGIWNIRMTWPLYRELFARWTPTDRTEWSQVWTHTPAPVVMPPEAPVCRVERGEGGAVHLRIPAPPGMGEAWWADVQADVAAEFEPTWQPVVGKAAVLEIVDTAWLPRPGVEGLPIQNARWAWTLRLGTGRTAMPVQLRPGETSDLVLRSHPIDRSSIRVSDCRVSMVRSMRDTLMPGEMEPTGFQARRSRGLSSWEGKDGREVIVLSATNPYSTLRLNVGDRLRIADRGRVVVVWRDFRMVAVQQDGEGDIARTVPSVGLFDVTLVPGP